ncbi:uncharacterized protein BP5553_03374 [Venustampulla echinocandica]|uniref:RNA polymerase I-specific transcription initiation factor RRN6-like protein n=1 Tax=Venustampulla echinocandica TaxID=2656787 RepID=A0A370TU40_9HELO|nr:uncharacterized protein BP5553_03374 [Venustampulla echinocandica]RDL39034.1 hypothetical protein BP5553_03374 [Venustampulla echinocandica]
MTDYRVTDLAFGHPGTASYDIEEKQWIFSANPSEQRIRQISQFKERLPPSAPTLLEGDGKHSDRPKPQLKRLLKTYPEAVPGNEIASSLSKFSSLSQPEPLGDSGSLLAIGRAAYSRNPSRIIALPCGEAGHVLRLIRLRAETRGWESQTSPNISLFHLDLSDQGYWMSTGGTIRQIVFSDDDESSTWLAVRQTTITTIFRPAFGQLQPAFVPSSSARIYPSSRLSANPVAFITAEKTQLQCHADISFNPWYCRQFILIDSSGHWCIWNIEYQQTRSSPQDLVAGKSGSIDDDCSVDSILEPSSANNLDGWYRALWVGDINTIAICSRRSIVIFDLKARPTRLRSIELPPISSNRIIDIKRSLENQAYLFVLTTSQIIWIEVTPAGEEGSSGAKILLSYRHFRDVSDETLRLVAVKHDNVSIMITSRKSPLINVYGFSTFPERPGVPTSWKGSFMLAPELDNRQVRPFLSLYLCPAPLISDPGPQLEQSDIGLGFLQVWALSPDLTLSSAICIAHNAIPEKLRLPRFLVTAPEVPLSLFRARPGPVQRQDFVVPNGLDDIAFVATTPGCIRRDHQSKVAKMKQTDLRLRIDWKRIFKAVFPQAGSKYPHNESQLGTPGESSMIAELLTTIYDSLQQSRHENSLPNTTFLELSNCSGFSEELERATTIVQEFLQSLEQDEGILGQPRLRVSDIMSAPSIQFPTSEGNTFSGFLKIYDHMVEIWMASLPAEVSVTTRLSKYKIIRQVAIELCLSSVVCSLRRSEPSAPGGDEDEDVRLPSSGAERPAGGTSPALYSPDMTPEPSQKQRSGGVPTLSRTPSLYSHATSVSRSGSIEDPAVSRLRQYAVSIKSQPDSGKLKLPSQWVVGDNPDEYSWESAKDTSMAENGERGASRRNREESQRRQLKEKFLSRERLKAAVSQPAFTPFGSQPDPGKHAFSSQSRGDIPMTQPDRGTFGSRSLQKPNKKVRRRNAGF